MKAPRLMLELPELPNRFTWRLLVLSGLATAAVGIAQGFVLDPTSVVLAITVLVVMLGIAHVYTARRPEPMLALPAILVAYFVANGLVFGSLSYFVAGFNRPLIDAHLAVLDPLVGFDWHALQRFTAEHETFALVSTLVYHSSPAQIFVVWASLVLAGDLKRLSLFLTAMVIATALCIAAASLWPAAGAYTYFAVPESSLGHLAFTNPGAWHMMDFTALRDGSMRVVDLSRLQGIVTFPSFHTIVALLCGWALINMRWIGIPFALHSAFIVLTTLPVGGHYLADLAAGGAITVVAVVAAKRIEAASRQEQDAPTEDSLVSAADA